MELVRHKPLYYVADVRDGFGSIRIFLKYDEMFVGDAEDWQIPVTQSSSSLITSYLWSYLPRELSGTQRSGHISNLTWLDSWTLKS